MAFEIVQKPAFYYDLVSLPRNVQRGIPAAVRHISADPFRGNGQAKRVLKHAYRNLYRYRLGDYRIVYSVGDGCVCLLGISHRRDVYDRFTLDSPDSLPRSIDASSAAPQIIPTTVYDTFNSVQGWSEDGDAGTDVDDDDADDDDDAGDRDDAAAGRDDGDDVAVGDGPSPNGVLTPGSTRGTAGWLLEELLEHWGVAEQYRQPILQCSSLEDLLDLDIPDDVKERLLHWHRPPTLNEIIEQSTMELRDPDDLDRYVQGDLKRFLLKLDPDQERAAARSLRGPVLVKGGPGTGKSLVALYRIRNLLEAPAQVQLFAAPRPRILLLTYTRSLINVCQELLEELLGEIPEELQVMTLDRKVREIITRAGHEFRPARKEDKERALQEALEDFTPPGHVLQQMALRHSLRSLRPDYILDEFDWVIEGRALKDLDAYLEEDRTGRGIRLGKPMRHALWELHQRYLANLRARRLSTWDLYRQQAEELLRTQMPDERHDVVIVDEAQDLTPAGLRVCVALARHPEGLYLTADASQSIYNRGFAWSRVHADLQVRGRSLILKRNYRSTEQIAEAAAQLLRDHGGGDDEALSVEAVRSGPKPTLAACRDEGHELQVIADYLREAAVSTRLPVGSGAVLVRTHRDAAGVAEGLSELGIPARHVQGDEVTLDTEHVRVMTIHTAKGLEFPFVVVARVNAGVLPHMPADVEPEEAEQRMTAERRLLFVGLSRAMRRLLVTYSRANPSPFIGELAPHLWTRRVD